MSKDVTDQETSRHPLNMHHQHFEKLVRDRTQFGISSKRRFICSSRPECRSFHGNVSL